jgi:hypothetical protein
MSAEDRVAWIQGMRQLLDVLERDESIPLPGAGEREPAVIYVHGHRLAMTGERLADMVRALGGEGWTQRTKRGASGNITWLEITGRIKGLKVEINADADQVCEPVEPRPVIERKCPELDAVIAGERCAKCHAEPRAPGGPYGAKCLDMCHEATEFDHVCMICATPEEAKALGFPVVPAAQIEAEVAEDVRRIGGAK